MWEGVGCGGRGGGAVQGFSLPAGDHLPLCVAYHRFSLSLRDVEELVLESGIEVTYETVGQWTRRFGPQYTAALRRRRPRPGDRWHLGGVFVKVQGRHATCGVRSTPRGTSSTS